MSFSGDFLKYTGHTDHNRSNKPILHCFGREYTELAQRKIGAYTISKLEYTHDDDRYKISSEEVRMWAIRRARHTFIGPNIHDAVRAWRIFLLSQAFERKIWEYKINHPDAKNARIDWENTMRGAIHKSLHDTRNKQLGTQYRKIFYEWVQNIPRYVREIVAISDKYGRAGQKLYELDDITMERLVQTIDKTWARGRGKLNTSCTRWVKRRPVSAHEMLAIIRAGYKNPGAFPYSWISKIPRSLRGRATQKIHNILRDACIKLYSPEDYVANTDELNTVAEKISRIIGQKITITYMASGNFAKAYIMQIPGDKKYVWKIYHCDRTNQALETWLHHTELQNSFLVSGRKYFGKYKFRKILTAGISNQRGEMYLLYQYTPPQGEQHTEIKWPQHYLVQKYYLFDTNRYNLIGNTIIDIGALNLNRTRWQMPSYVNKIINTVLYQSWDALGFLTNNYTDAQIQMALDFMDGRLTTNAPNYTLLCNKINFLKSRMRTR